MLMELGKRLKEKRLEEKITLDDLQSITKIQKRYLEAVEEGNFDVLPGKFYARAFIKQYAEAVGLDPEELFDVYASEIPKTVKEEVPEQLSRSSKKRPTTFRPKNTALLLRILQRVLVSVLIVGLAIMIWIFLQDKNSQVQPPEEMKDGSVESEIGSPSIKDKDAADPNSPKADTPLGDEEMERDSAAENKVEEPEAEESGAQDLAEISQSTDGTPYTTYELKGAKEFVVVLTVKQNSRSYIGVENGKGKSFYNKEMSNGQQETFNFTAEQEIEFNIGNTGAIDLLINDQPVVLSLDKPHQRIKVVYKKEIE
jgi:cytoskeletal protein RodZ